jgi:hypothetical protein
MKSFVIFFSSLNIVREIKSKRAKVPGYVSSMKETQNAHTLLLGKLEGREKLEKSGVDKRKILKEFLKYNKVQWTRLILFRVRPNVKLI